MHRSLRLALAVAIAALLSGCSSHRVTPAGASDPGTPPTASQPLVGGFYVNGPEGTPHWFIQMDVGPHSAFRGTIAFEYQDGQTGLSQTFTGRAEAGLLTFTFSRSGVQTGSVGLARPGPTTISLGECSDYLRFIASMGDCTFTHARSLAD